MSRKDDTVTVNVDEFTRTRDSVSLVYCPLVVPVAPKWVFGAALSPLCSSLPRVHKHLPPRPTAGLVNIPLWTLPPYW
jgi:hypothetical protein